MPAARPSRIKPYYATLLWTAVLAALLWFATQLFTAADTALYAAAGQRCMGWEATVTPQLVPQGQSTQMEDVTLRERTRECPVVGMVELNQQEVNAAFAETNLSPQDMSVLLNCLAKGGVKTVGVSASFVWPNGVGEMGKLMLCHTLTRFEHSAVGLRGRTAAQAQFTPLMLRDAAIPADNVTGDPAKLPMANCPLPNGLTDAPDSLEITWAPDWLQGEPMTQKPSAVEDMSFPLLVRWNGETIPTLPFRLALAHLGLNPADVKVNIGKNIVYGGFTLPLDEYGRTRLQEARVVSVPLADVMGGQVADGGITAAVVEQPDETQGADTTLRLERLARTLSQMAGKEKITLRTECRPVGGAALQSALPVWEWKGYAAALIALFIGLRVFRRFPLTLNLLLAAGAAAWLLHHAYQQLTEEAAWLPLTALLLWLLSAVIICRLHKPAKPKSKRQQKYIIVSGD